MFRQSRYTSLMPYPWSIIPVFMKDNDLKLAVEVQRALLDRQVPHCKCGRIVVRNMMCSDIGGDFYHFKQLNGDQVAFAIGDVMGHGMSAALIVSLLMGKLWSTENSPSRPQTVVNELNQMLVELGDHLDWPVTSTIFLGVIDLPSGIIMYVNAGHNKPIHLRRSENKTSVLTLTNMLLGVQRGIREEDCEQFGQGDRLVLYTDGITEAMNLDLVQFGDKRLVDIIQRTADKSPEDVADVIFDELDRFSAGRSIDDDMTLIIIDFDEVNK